jgi:hypothetical protein
MFDWPYLLGYGMILVVLVLLGVVQTQRRRAGDGAARGQGLSGHLSTFGEGVRSAGGSLWATIVSDVIFWTALILLGAGILLIALVVTATVAKFQYLLIGALSLPLVIAAGYVIYRSERWWFRELRALTGRG